MECKVQIRQFLLRRCADLIGTLWNVKIPDDVLENNGTLDLIETLWNVKFHPCRATLNPRFDLIETLWNVKNAVFVDIDNIFSI